MTVYVKTNACCHAEVAPCVFFMGVSDVTLVPDPHCPRYAVPAETRLAQQPRYSAAKQRVAGSAPIHRGRIPM